MPAPRTYVVQHGDSLWRIAENELGDGTRWPDIAELNYGRTQPDGGALDSTHWITAGWRLALPADTAQPAVQGTAAAAAPATHVVEEGDTLWDIAAKTLGDGARYTELYEASRDTIQPDGDQLRDPDLIRPGWTITIPTVGPAPTPTSPAAPAEPAPPGEQAPPAEQPPAADVPPAEQPAPVAEQPAPPAAEPAPPTAEQPPATNEPPVADEDTPSTGEAQLSSDDVDGFPLRTVAGVGSLLAAGLLVYVTAKRRTQQRRRQPGERIAMPDGAVAGTERELRTVADPMSVETVDLALRGLAASCARRGTPLPPVRVARLTAEQFELYLTEPTELPAPFEATEQAHVWFLPTTADTQLDPDELRDVAAPYPSLVTVGHGPEDGHLLLDLERLGTLTLVGDTRRSREVMAALAVELATSPWADDLQVTLVGTCPELARGLDTGRIRHLPTIGSLLDELSRRAAVDRDVLRSSGASSLDHARARGVAAATWTPEIVLLGQPLSHEQRSRLTELVQAVPRVAVAAVTSGDDPVGEWTLELTAADPDLAVLQPVGVEVHPQRLDQHQYGQILELLGITEQPAVRWADATAEPVMTGLFDDELPPAHPGRLDTADHEEPLDEPAPVTDGPTILLLGPVEVEAATGPVEQSKYRQLTEIAAYIALHPGLDHAALDEAIWPGNRVTQNTRNTAISKLRRWFGSDPHGQDYLPRVDTGYRFNPGVTTDWDRWVSTVGGDPRSAPTQQLVASLELVRGQPFTGVNPRRYAWAEHLKQEMIAAIVDAAHEVAQRALKVGDAHLARKAATIGLQVEPGMELLWRDRIRAEHAAGNRAGIDDAVARMTAISADLGDDLEEDTVRLLDELVPAAPMGPPPEPELSSRF